MREPDDEETRYESWARFLDLSSTSWAQWRKREGHPVAMPDIHLGQRLERYRADGVMMGGRSAGLAGRVSTRTIPYK